MDDPQRAPWAKSRTGRARNANRAPSRFAVRDARLADRLGVRFATQKLTSNGCPAAVQQRGAIQGDAITRSGEVIFAGCCHWRQRGWVGRGLARPDRQSFSQGLAIVQLVGASAEIAMAGSHRRMLVVDFGGLAISGERPQDGVETPAFERILLRLQKGAARGRVGRDRFGRSGQVFANMIEINQIAALVAELLLDLPDDPWRASPTA